MGLVWTLMSASLAFAPEATTSQGVDPQRPYVVHPGEQGRLLASDAFRAFRATDGRGWSARFDETVGVPRWLYGAGIPVRVGSEDALVSDLSALLERHARLFGFVPGTLRASTVQYSARTDTWYVDFDELRPLAGGHALPTWRGGISARIKHGKLVLLEVRTNPRARVTGALALGERAAIDAAIRGGAAPGAVHTATTAVPTLFERWGAGRHDLRVTWLVRSATETPPGRWSSFVDAETGEVLYTENEIRFVDGTVTAKHHLRTVDGSALVESPAPLAWVDSDGASALTDTSGDYTITADGPYTTSLTGDYAQVHNYVGADGSLTSTSPDLVWTSSNASQAEIDTYVFLHQVREWGLVYAPDIAWVQGSVYSLVNLPYVCNAFYAGGAVYFFSAGGGCNNSGQIADVVYHEWGHGLHDYSLKAGFFDGSLSEGAADTVAFLQTGDHYIAPNFGTSGWAIRDVAPNHVYPQDYDFSGYYVHNNGLIFGGSMWDLLDLLTDTVGKEQAVADTSAILAGLLESGPDIPGSFYAALVADDDDGDLENGTPHICELYDAFSQHGIGSAPGGNDIVLTTHEPIAVAVADEPTPVEVDLVSLEAGCVAVGAQGAEVHFRVDGGSWQVAALDASGDAITGEIPAQPDGSIVEYYVTGESDGGTEFASPHDAEVNPYSFYVGEAIEVHCDDFELTDGEYKVSDGQSFEWGTPLGLSTDPAGAYSGTQVWGLDVATNGLYGNNELNGIKSPKIETKHYSGVFLQYRRWLGVEDGLFDQATISVNGQDVWANWVGAGEEHTVDDEWRNHVVDLQGLADQGTAKIGFSLASDEAYQLGGWNVDDVCLMAPATADNRLGITDFVAVPTSDTTVHLSWTNPPHKPLKVVKVVRRADQLPDGEAGGEAITTLDLPEKGAFVEIDDTNYHPGTTGYAVYAFDGDVWLSWTVEGWNAAQVDLVGDPTLDVPPDGKGGNPLAACGCANEAPASVAWWVGGLLVAATRRRAIIRRS